MVERARDMLAGSSLSHLTHASDELDAAVTYLTDALETDPVHKKVLLAKACAHLRDAIETAS
ncbi:hypothetical protein [Streptomyces sp. NPDC023588]|uniref:hypothetical protein n=1 Tax=Streptomyces sp. NPDC023588 TaxID=3154907 RepID=UPI0033D5B078